MSQNFRVDKIGLVNRDNKISFKFNGKSYFGYEGDTLASALIANGVHLVGTRFKYHRPRGFFGAGHFYCSQSDKGEMVMGGDLDGYNSYAQRGNLPTLQHVLTEGIAMFPFLSKLKMLRTWGGIMDMSMDGSPIIDKTHIEGLYLNCGWCYGGFKATPASGWTFAHTIAQDRVHELNAGYSLNRFSTGHLIDEKGLGTKTWIS